MRRRTTPARDAWVVRANPKPEAALRLFCFTYAGGGTAFFNKWHTDLPDSVEVCPIRTPGRESRLREPAFTRISELVPVLTTALLPFLDKPFVFFGHSLGGMVSFETVRHLRKLQQPQPLALMIGGCRAPHIRDHDDPIYTLDDKGFIDGIRKLKGTPEQVLKNRELLGLILPLLRADFEASETYAYHEDAPLSMPLIAFSGDADDKARPADVARWSVHTTSTFTHHELAGEHFFLHDRPFMPQFSAEISRLAKTLQ